MNRLRRLGPGPWVFLAIWLLLLAGGRSGLFRDPGTFWHTRVGERIMDHGFFETDPFTFSRYGEYWVPQQWLGEVTLGLAQRVGGPDLQLLLAVSIIAALFTWITLRLLRTGAHPVLAIPVAGLALAAAANHFHVRPHLFTIAALAVTAGVLTDFDAGRIRVRRLWLLVPVYLLWTNIHGGILGGLTTLALVGLGWMAWAVIGWPTPFRGWRITVVYWIVFAACLLTTPITPYGTDIARAWFVILNLKGLSEAVQEHAPLAISDPSGWPALALAVVFVFVLSGIREKPRVVWLFPFFWLYEGFSHVRHISLFAVVTVIAIADIWPATIWARRLVIRRPDLQAPVPKPPSSPLCAWLLPAACVLATAGLQIAGVRVPVFGAGWAMLDPERWPVGLLDAIHAHEPPPGAPPGHIFDESEYGGFLIYHIPRFRVFFDDRFELHGSEMMNQFVQASRDYESTPTYMEEWQRKFGRFDAALVHADGTFDQYFRSKPDEWQLTASTETAVFYTRRK